MSGVRPRLSRSSPDAQRAAANLSARVPRLRLLGRALRIRVSRSARARGASRDAVVPRSARPTHASSMSACGDGFHLRLLRDFGPADLVARRRRRQSARRGSRSAWPDSPCIEGHDRNVSLRPRVGMISCLLDCHQSSTSTIRRACCKRSAPYAATGRARGDRNGQHGDDGLRDLWRTPLGRVSLSAALQPVQSRRRSAHSRHAHRPRSRLNLRPS